MPGVVWQGENQGATRAPFSCKRAGVIRLRCGVRAGRGEKKARDLREGRHPGEKTSGIETFVPMQAAF